MMMGKTSLYQSILSYSGKRYLWASLALTVFALAIFALPHAVESRNGGTWQGYTLGTIATMLIVWLLWLGIRKRQYKNSVGSYQGWVSAHVYLGISVAFIASFHSAFQLGMNIHSLAYVLLLTVVLSGVWGLWAYLSLPERTSKVRNGLSRDACFTALSALDEQILGLAQQCKADVAKACESAVVRTVIGGSARDILWGIDRSVVELQLSSDSKPNGAESNDGFISNAGQKPLIDWLANRLSTSLGGKETESLQQLLSLFAQRRVYVQRLREDIRLHAWLKFWLYLHVPMSLGLLVALIAHILSVFLYW